MNPNTQPPVKSEDDPLDKLVERIRYAHYYADYHSALTQAQINQQIEKHVAAEKQAIRGLIKQEAERHADAVIGEDDLPLNTLEHSRRNFLRSEQRNRNHYPLDIQDQSEAAVAA